MINDDIKWIMLQVQFPEKYPLQSELLSQPLSRDDLLRECVKIISTSIRIKKKENLWGLAEVSMLDSGNMACRLTVRPSLSHIAEEPEPGILEKAHEPRFITNIVIHVTLQIIAINISSDISRYARSALAYSSIFHELLSEAVRKLDMAQHYEVEVEPIAKTGSFIEWCNSLDKLIRIAFHYVGPNLPSRPDSLVKAIKDNAIAFKRTLNSATIDLVANEPHLHDEEIEELDRAVSQQQLKMKAKGLRAGVGTKWSSSKRREPEVIQVQMQESDLTSPQILATKIERYLLEYFNKR